MVTKLSVEPAIPRTVARQMHRNNVPAENPEEYYRRVIAVPLIDRFISEMTFRFNSFNKTGSKLLFACTINHMPSRLQPFGNYRPNESVIR